jgi:hypothetical protein
MSTKELLPFYIYTRLSSPALVTKPANLMKLSNSITWSQISSIERCIPNFHVKYRTCYYYYFSIEICAFKLNIKSSVECSADPYTILKTICSKCLLLQLELEIVTYSVRVSRVSCVTSAFLYFCLIF